MQSPLSHSIAGTATPRPGVRDDAAPAEGSLRGERVQAIPAEGLALDSVEEVSMHFAEPAEEKKVEVESAEPEFELRLMDPDEILTYYASTHNEADAQRMLMLVKLMASPGASPALLAQSSFTDETLQHLALQMALHEARRDDASADVVARLREALTDLDDDAGPRIRANLNTVAAAGSSASDAAGVAHFQQTYVDIVLGEPTLHQTLQQALRRFGAQGFADGLALLMKAIGQDLSAAHPSTSAVRLRALVQDLYQLQVVNTTLADARTLSGRLNDVYDNPAFAPEELVRDVVDITAQRWISPDRFATLSLGYAAVVLAARITFLVGVKGLLSGLPAGVFSDIDARSKILDSAQLALDEVAEREAQEQEQQDEQQDDDSAAADGANVHQRKGRG